MKTEICRHGNGSEALEVIRETSPDLVLTDVEMPLMNGLELAHRASEEIHNLCFVIISGYQDFEYARDAIRSGVLDYLTKPIVPSKMLTTMKSVEEKLRRFYYDKRNGIFRKVCMGETIALEEMRKLFPHKEYYAALLRENGLPRRYSPAKEPELYGTINEAFSVYGRDNMEELFLIPREVLGEQSLIDYMTKVELRQKTEGSYTTLLYFGEAFSRTEISERVRDLYYWLNTLSTVGATRSWTKYEDLVNFLNADKSAATVNDGNFAMAAGEATHWIMLTQQLPLIIENMENPDDIGVFGVPGEDADNHGLTVWEPMAWYVNKDSANIEAIKAFFEFYYSEEALDLYFETYGANGPSCIKGYELPESVCNAVRVDMQKYFDEGKTIPALEYLSPIKGTTCEQMTTAVGLGQMSGADAAADYDADCKKSAIQLGYDWE